MECSREKGRFYLFLNNESFESFHEEKMDHPYLGMSLVSVKQSCPLVELLNLFIPHKI